ncbi:MAG: hypothetical protein GY804_02925 [Alphaproteobacteria bacterium]|nr:hypothetical protein [Alphaproteobacteria bacterium]
MKKNKNKIIGVRVTPDTSKMLNDKADKMGITPSNLARIAIEKEIKRGASK